ncbi:hypothetical protein GT347_14910 [Xylophilus rhododendri]|uniref:Uncharacterized protein n=1 Tax=Xylophilus rhododendri TaxID=2697032 RepID=A0A857J818_9BURK|nr:hypothetical protein [Xylophilus rhododendri]QHI99152.1 hypothetical protein GT347_14910 [Xylophilus rhododendri]
MFAEVRSATSTPVALGSAVGISLPSSPYHWVSASIGSDGQTVAAHWSDGGSNPAFLAGMIPTSGYPAAPPPTPKLTGVLGAPADWLDYSEPGKALQGIMPGESFVAGGAKATMLFLAGHIGVGDVGKAAQVADDILRVGKTGLNPASDLTLGLRTLDPAAVSFTQSSVSFAKAGAEYNLDTLVKNMSTEGWIGKPIDVVAMPDGTLASIDNTRVLAARRAGIDVEANVRGFDEAITDPARQLSLIERGQRSKYMG